MREDKNREWFTLEDLKYAKKILNFQVSQPPACICGASPDNYCYGVYNENELVAKCMRCNYRRRFNVKANLWGGVDKPHVFLDVKGKEVKLYALQ